MNTLPSGSDGADDASSDHQAEYGAAADPHRRPDFQSGPRRANKAPPAHECELPRILWGEEMLAAEAGPKVPWLWRGILHPGALTLLTAQWKSGKTTLAAVLLARLGSGGELAGRPVGTGRAVVVTEENVSLWQLRTEELGIGAHVGWCCRPFRGRPALKDWLRFVDGLIQVHERGPFDLLVIDPLAAFMPGSENSAGCMMDVLLPLQRLAARRVSVFVLHHPSKGDPTVGQASRGNGALLGCVDIQLEMKYFRRAGDDDSRRRLWGLSRYKETPKRLVLELTPDGKDYISHGTFEDEQFNRMWRRLRAVCADAPRKLTRPEIYERWKATRKPHRQTLWRWLEQAVAQDLLRQDGKGVRGKPLRYWLPAKEDEWRKDEWACLLMPELAEKKEEGR
jgi:hypothetical protein